MPLAEIDERAVARVVRGAALSSYGVAAVSGMRWHHRLAQRLGIHSGVDVDGGPPMRVSVNVHLAPGVPAAQVAANVVEAVRYTVQRDVGQHVEEVTVTVDGLPTAGADPAPPSTQRHR